MIAPACYLDPVPDADLVARVRAALEPTDENIAAYMPVFGVARGSAITRIVDFLAAVRSRCGVDPVPGAPLAENDVPL